MSDTWSARLDAAWKLSSNRKWSDAQARFDALHQEQPLAVDPIIGLGVVARGEGRYSVARERFREALALDPSSTSAQDLLRDTEWDRPLILRFDAGSSTAQGTVTSTWSASGEVPVNPSLALTGRLAILGGGDAFQGIFINNDSTGIRQYVASLGVIARPSQSLTLTARGDRWSSHADTTQTYVWFDGAFKVTDRMLVHATARPIAAGNGEPQFGGGVEYTLRHAQVIVLDVAQGIREAAFDARTVVRAFLKVDPSRSITYRVGFARDIDHRFNSTTGIGALTWYARPTFGVRTELSDREGVSAHRSANAGIVLRW